MAVMEAFERRAAMLKEIECAKTPITGSALAKLFAISRQVVVQDIALLRAGGNEIIATPNGYIVATAKKRVRRVITCHHNGKAGMIEEMFAIVDSGGLIINVFVEHPVYGEVRADLMFSSRSQIIAFVDKMEAANAEPLARLTGGVHMHIVEADSASILGEIEQKLTALNILIKE